MRLDKNSTRILLGQGIAEDSSDARALAATVVFKMPDGMQEVRVEEFLGQVQGSDPELVRKYQEAAMIGPGTTLGDLTEFQRAALIGALRFRGRTDQT